MRARRRAQLTRWLKVAFGGAPIGGFDPGGDEIEFELEGSCEFRTCAVTYWQLLCCLPGIKHRVQIITVLSVALWLALASPAGAQVEDEGAEPTLIAEEEARRASLLTQAEQGDAEAQYKLGVTYARGLGVSQNGVPATPARR